MTSPNSLHIGLTGGIACGKSTAAKILSEHYNFALCDADLIAHQALQQPPIIQSLTEHFGPRILHNGLVDRSILGHIIFSSPSQRLALNHITHPAIISACLDFLSSHTRALIDAALLFETQLHLHLHASIAILCPTHSQIQRLVLRNHLTPQQALQRIQSQNTNAYRCARATHILYNCSALPELEAQIHRLMRGFA